MIITGRNAIREALRAGNVKSLSVLSRLDKDPVVKEARGLNVPVKLVDDNELTRMAKNSSHQGFVAISKDLETVTLDELIQSAKNTTYPLLLMLDGILGGRWRHHQEEGRSAIKRHGQQSLYRRGELGQSCLGC